MISPLHALEPRLLLSGTLTITGDANPNDLAIDGAASNNLTVTAFDGEIITRTGDTAGTFVGVKNLIINLAGGNDNVTIIQARQLKAVTINTADGNDTV